MLTNTVMISLGTAVLSILLVFAMRRNILKQPEGYKRIIDAVKIVSDEVRKRIGYQNTVLFPMTAAAFVLTMYLLDWQTALAFLTGALATILINLILPHVVAQNSGRVVEASRKNISDGANIALKSGVVSALLILGIGLFVTAGFYAIFQNTQILIGLGFGVVLTALYTKLSSPGVKESEIDPNSSIAIFELTVLAAIITMILAKATFAKSNPTLFPLILISASVISFLAASFFMRFFRSTLKLTTSLYTAFAVQTVLFAATVYLAKAWLLKGIGINSLLNFYGLALVTLIVLSLAGMTILLKIYHQIVSNATLIAEKSEIAEEVKKRLFEMNGLDKLARFITKYYIVKCTALTSVLFFTAYYLSIQKSFSLDIGNYLVLIGLFIGLILISLFYWQKSKFKTDSMIKNILLTISIVILPVVICLILGPVALDGYVISIILFGLLATIIFDTGTHLEGECPRSEVFGNIVRLTAVIALLIVAYIS